MEVVDYLVNIVGVNTLKADPFGKLAHDIAAFFGHDSILKILKSATSSLHSK